MIDLKEFFKCYHLDINSIILEWIITCFSELISPDQLFKIYDILIITNNYQVLILFALALLDNKKSKIMGMTSKIDIVTLFKNYKYEDIDIFNVTKVYLETNILH